MSTMTIFLGKLLGLYLFAISTGMLVSKRRTLATLDEMARSGPWMLFSGIGWHLDAARLARLPVAYCHRANEDGLGLDACATS